MATIPGKHININRRSPVDGRGLRILIVEDYTDNAITLALLLQMYGHEVQVAKNGVEALKKTQEERPDVLLLDIGLPGMSGYEVARKLKEERPRKTPFLIALTGYGQDEDRRHSTDAGIDLHLVKPVEPEELQVILERYRKVIHH